MTRDWDDLNRAATARLEALLDRLGPGDYLREEDGWTVAAILGHLAFWDRRGALVLRAWDAGHEPRRADDHFYDSEVLNGALLAEWLALPGPAAAALARAAARDIDAVVAGLSDATVTAVAEMDELWRLRRHDHRLEHVEQVARLVG